MHDVRQGARLDAGTARRFYWAAGLNGLAFGLEVSALPLYLLTFNLPATVYGVLVGSAWLVSLVVRMPIGALSFRVGNRPLLFAGCWAFAPLTWALLLPGGVPLLFAARLLNGGARSLIVLPMRSWFTELCARGEMAALFGRLNASYAVGQSLIGLLVGPILLSALGPTALLGLIGALPLLIWWLLRPVPPDHPAASAQAAEGTSAPRLLWPVALCSVAASSVVSAHATFIPVVVLDLGWPVAVVGFLLFLQGVGTFVGARYNGLLIGRLGERTPALVGLVFVAAAALALYWTSGGLALPLIALLSGLAAGSIPTLVMGFAARALPSRSRGIAVQETFVSLGLGAGSALGGLVITWLDTPRAGMLACVPFALAGIAAILLTRRHLRTATAR
jgi:predicted MFS family arabinose efflux permease